MATRNRANLQAGLIVEKALAAGMTFSEIAEKTGTEVSTVQRWRSTGKGEAVHVRKLERLVGPDVISPEDLSTYLSEEYSIGGKKKAFAIYDSDLYQIVGSSLDADGYLEGVRKNLRLRGYEFLQTRKGTKVIYHVISFARINKITSENIRDMKGRRREMVYESMSSDEE